MRKHFSRKEHGDSGLALVLLFLLSYFFFDWNPGVAGALFSTLAVMVYPPLVYPFTLFWLNFSRILGHVMSFILLSAIYFIFVVPVGLARRAMGKDTLKLRSFRKGEDPVWITRDHVFESHDLEYPY